MTPESRRAILAITLHAAFADGAKHDRERDEIRRIADSLATEAGAPDLARLYQEVLLKRVTLDAYYERGTLAASAPEAQVILYDDVVVATARIGCRTN